MRQRLLCGLWLNPASRTDILLCLLLRRLPIKLANGVIKTLVKRAVGHYL
jgi:hypothetical protein